MLNSRQRAQLRGLANDYETILQIGKSGISDNTIKQVNDALEARELIKLRVLEACPLTSREAADELANAMWFRLSALALFFTVKARTIKQLNW